MKLPPRFDSQGRRWHHPDYLKEEKMSGSYNKARHIARAYQSPGAIGKVFAAFASGIPVTYSDFMAEIEATMRECGNDALEDMSELREFAELSAGDFIWKKPEQPLVSHPSQDFFGG